MDYAHILTEAHTAAAQATQAKFAEIGDWGAAGFAWVEVPKGPAVAHLIAAGMMKGCGEPFHCGALAYDPGDPPAQSIAVHEAGAKAFAEVLDAHGIQVFAWSRRD